MFTAFEIKVIVAGILTFALLTFLYTWHYAPMGELKELKVITQNQKNELKVKDYKVQSVGFEEKHKAIKAILQTKKEKTNEEVNLSRGKHSLTIH